MILPIVTVDSPQAAILQTHTKNFGLDELQEAREIGEKLKASLAPFGSAAGLAAPQIGIGRSIFIYSYDRDPDHLEVVINPHFQPVGEEKVVGWEGCFSVFLSAKTWKLASIPRYQKIKASYLNGSGERLEKILDGFTAKVFQHEFDHLQGITVLDRKDAEVKMFPSKEELLLFLAEVKKDDAEHYKKPVLE